MSISATRPSGHFLRPPIFRYDPFRNGNKIQQTPREGQQMASHGTPSRYSQGCRCADCAEAHRLRAIDYRTRKEESEPPPAQTAPGQVETALARLLDDPRAKTAKPAAAKVLVSVLDTLHKGSAQGRRGNLAVVKSMTEKGKESG
jgi:hypothetical protein